MFKLLGTPFTRDINTLLEHNCHEVYQNQDEDYTVRHSLVLEKIYLLCSQQK